MSLPHSHMSCVHIANSCELSKRHTRGSGDYIVRLIAFFWWEYTIFYYSHSMNFNLIFLFSFLFSLTNYRELYPRVLECILQTELPELILSSKDEILETLNIVANDAGTFLLRLFFSFIYTFINYSTSIKKMLLPYPCQRLAMRIKLNANMKLYGKEAVFFSSLYMCSFLYSLVPACPILAHVWVVHKFMCCSKYDNPLLFLNTFCFKIFA